MTNFYLISGKDPSSDNGYWEVIVQASNADNAFTILLIHLKQINRKDLETSIDNVRIVRADIGDIPILYSTIEHV